MTANNEVAIIAGANRGLGSELSALLIGRGYRVAAVGREAAVSAVAEAVPNVMRVTCDLTRESEVEDSFTSVEAAWGAASVVVYNAHLIELRAADQTSLELFEESWRVNCYGAFVVAKRATRSMLLRGRGTLLFSGASGSVRGARNASAFASSKFALRGLAQSLAREHAGSGIHVAHVVLDGLIWSERTRTRFNPEERNCMSARAVAEAYLAVIEQDRSAWSHELELRPWTAR